MSTRQFDPLLPLPTLVALLLTLAVIAAPHAVWLPFWVTALALTCGAWRYLAARRGDPLPPTWLRTLLTVAVSAGIYASFGTLLGRDAGTALLTSMTALKLLEMRRRRDTHVVMYLGFFLIATQFLYSQSLPSILYLLLAVWAMTMVLISVHQASTQPRPWRYAGLAASMVLQAIPVMLVLFVLFPRFVGPLWRMPADGHGASTGLSETMSPGDISQLSRSDAVAFRVRFADEVPPRQTLYWRGLVLDAYDGRTWSRGPIGERSAPAELRGEPVRYTVTLEPSNQRWLFALDLPEGPPAKANLNASLNGAFELQAQRPVTELLRYSVVSRTDYRLQSELDPAIRARYLRLPPSTHPRATALAHRWRDAGGGDAAVLRRAIEFFLDRPFVYTLSPPRLEGDAVDQFLFDTQRGFCEHYAGAFAVLLRAAGVPARVVLGYMGGEVNRLGDYMIVRQSDAHAWTEVWLSGHGWVRIDPTGLVAPSRVEHGMAEAVLADDPVPLMARSGGLFKGLRLRWDGINSGWDNWVLGYGPQLQQRLLSRVGLQGWQQTVMGLGGAMVVVIGIIALVLLGKGRQPPRDPLRHAYDRFCRKLARRGLARRPEEGPQHFARRVDQARPELGAQVMAITRLYVQLRYAEQGARDELERLRGLVRRFRP